MSLSSMDLAGMAVAIFFYGIYFNLFLISTYLLARRSKSRNACPLYRSAMFVLGCALFLAVTGNCVAVTIQVFQAFIFFEDGTAAPAFFNDQGRSSQEPAEVALNAFFVISMLISDTMVIFRLWIVSRRSKLIVALPILTLVGLAVCGLLGVKTARNVKNIALVVNITPTLVFSLVTNIYCTGAIFWKVWNITRYSGCIRAQGTNLRDFLFMLIESAAFYTAWALVYIVMHEINYEGQFVFIIALAPLAGIVNALIQVRMALGKAIEPPASAVSTTPIQFVAESARDVDENILAIKPPAAALFLL
ncbi:hypothetical protein C8R44DRAFT_981411 [Mycena epipterygia]|nr:hypothetical protein C8R44DRAFT_981411 [Mycena epipterygia]